MRLTAQTFGCDAFGQWPAICFRLMAEIGRHCRLELAFSISGHSLGVEGEQSPLGDHETSQGKQREELSGILGRSPIAVLLVTKQLLDEVKRMLNLGPVACLKSLDLLVQLAQFGIRQSLSLARPQSAMPFHRAALVLFPYLDALIAWPTSPKAVVSLPCSSRWACVT